MSLLYIVIPLDSTVQDTKRLHFLFNVLVFTNTIFMFYFTKKLYLILHGDT